MGIFRHLFTSKKLKTIDTDFGELESFNVNGNDVVWKLNKTFLGSEIEILILGNKTAISENPKLILLDALKNEIDVYTESSNALKEQFKNAEIEFISMEKQFKLTGVSINDQGFEIMFQEKEGQHYLFTVYFIDNKQVGVSIDG